MNIPLQGELTVHRISDHHMFLLEQIAQVSGNEPVVANLAEVSEIDSAGVQLLLALRGHLSAAGIPFRLEQVQTDVASVLDTYHLDPLTLEPREDALHVITEVLDD